MVDRIYIEEKLLNHPRAQKITNKFKQAQIITINNYAEIFNPKSQNFRIQKGNPALIIAKKENKLVLPTPEGFGIGSNENYYFSHMLNCPYDCRYCFLQGMYSSANYVLFINYEDFMSEIAKIDNNATKESYFFSGYDADSLAFDPISDFTHNFLPFFNKLKNSKLELRTKSTQIRSLLQHDDCSNIITAFSFTPEKISKQIEHKVPDFNKRLDAINKLANHGYQIGLRFDPLIYASNFKELYQEMLKQVFSNLDTNKIHSISLGPLRFPEHMFKKIRNLYPEEKLFSYGLTKTDQLISYKKEIEEEISNYVINELDKYITNKKIFNCMNNG